jgi:hypothetical protein
MSKAFVPDLEQARDLQSAIEIITATGQRYVTGVVDIDLRRTGFGLEDPSISVTATPPVSSSSPTSPR